jgi:LPXTG-motif cell wall-anchored protein
MKTFTKHIRNLALAGFTAGIGITLLPTLHADEWNKKTVLTITEPLEVPSCCAADHTVVLQPGEYVMVLVDSLSDRHIVRIFDKDQKNVMATILAIPNYRLKPTGKTALEYWEVPAGQPRALRAWFYPGDNFGQEFAYPKQRAAALAAVVKTPVPAIEVETAAAEDLKTVPLVAVDETGNSTKYVASAPEAAPAPVVEAAKPTPEPVAVVAPVATPDPTPELTPELPHTASAMPLLGLAGLVSLALFAALGFKTRRDSKV